MTASWTDPKSGTEVRAGDVWQDREPIYARGPIRTVDVLGPVIDGARGRERVRIAFKTRDYRWRGRDIKGHLVHVSASEFVKRFVLVGRAPEPAPADPNALKPCPFCGGPDLEVRVLADEDGDHKIVVCDGCGTMGPGSDPETPESSREAETRRLWNQRATEAKAGGAG